ncbi:MAG: glycoside hydrolase family 36 protein [Anaerolineae bacterium]
MLRRLLQSPSFELSWEPRLGVFRLESPGRLFEGEPGIEYLQGHHVYTLTASELTAGRETETEREDAHGQAHEIEIHYQETQGIALSLRMRLYPARPFALMQLSATNVSPGTLRLRRFFLRSRPQGIVMTAPPSGCFVNGWQSWSPARFRPASARAFRPGHPVRWLHGPMIHNPGTPWGGQPGRFWSEMVGAVVTSREALIGGAVSTSRQFAQLWADVRPAHLQVMLQTQLDDVPLDVGESRHSEWFYIEWVPLPNGDPFAQYAHAVARQLSLPSIGRSPTGWCSWYVYGDEVSEAHVIDNLASAALLADELPLSVIQIDDGYQSAWGDWSTHNEKFPHSLSWIAERIRGSGFKPGLWLAPLVAERRSRLAREHPDWLLRNSAGRPVNAGLVYRSLGRALDPTHPDVTALLRETIDTAVNSWGYGYLKLDFLYAGALQGRRHNPKMTRAQALHHALTVIREAAGPDTFLLGSGVPFGPALGLVDAVRVGPDTAPQWAPDFWGLSRLVDQNPALPSLRNSLRSAAARAWMHGRWWVNDPDVLILRENKSELTEEEVLAQITLVGLSGGSVLFSDDLDDLPIERRALASVLLPPLLDGMDTIDLLESEMPEVVMVPVARPWGRWRLVALFNWTEEPVERELPEAITLSERKAYHIVDFWEHRYFLLGPGALRPVLHLPPHGVVLLGLRAMLPAPHLVSTTFHISQGAEITQWRLDEGEVTFTLDVGRLAKGSVWLALPSRPEAVYLDDKQLPEKAVRAVASGIWSISFSLNREGVVRVLWEASA